MGELSHSQSTAAIALPASSSSSSSPLLLSPSLCFSVSSHLLLSTSHTLPVSVSLSSTKFSSFFFFFSLPSSSSPPLSLSLSLFLSTCLSWFSSSFRQTSSCSTATRQVYHTANVHTLSEQLVLSSSFTLLLFFFVSLKHTGHKCYHQFVYLFLRRMSSTGNR